MHRMIAFHPEFPVLKVKDLQMPDNHLVGLFPEHHEILRRFVAGDAAVFSFHQMDRFQL